MIRGTDFILNPDKLEEQFQLVEVSEWIDYNTKEKPCMDIIGRTLYICRLMP